MMRDEDAVKVHVVNAEDMKQAVATEEVEPEHIIAVSFTLPAVGVSGENQEQESPTQILQLDPLRKVAYVSFNGSGQIFLAHSEAQANALQSGTQQNADSGFLITVPTVVKVEGTGPLWAVGATVTVSEDTQSAHGQATTPTAGQAIATISAANLPAGSYIVQGTAYIDGTAVAATDDDNMQVLKQASVLVRLNVPADSTAPVTIGSFGPVYTTLNGSQSLSVVAVALATTGAVYHAQISATPYPFTAATANNSIVGVLSARRGA
jgi:hypothetical protein